MERVRLATANDATEIAHLSSDLILSEPLDDHWLALCTTVLAERLAARPAARTRSSRGRARSSG
ncbi:hypothetical protein [Streptomyces sp. NPDC058254]|uniref:hypothetical protein n=1 Tax=Streptomyces sp. NPDC058254 TaxID=3346406 RepID=UPI0036EFD59F